MVLFVLVSALSKTIVASSSEEEEKEDATKKLFVLSNFQGGSTCARDQGVAFPKDETEVRRAVLESRTTGMVRVVRATSGNAHWLRSAEWTPTVANGNLSGLAQQNERCRRRVATRTLNFEGRRFES